MQSQPLCGNGLFLKKGFAWIRMLLVLSLAASASPAQAQTFSSRSDGSDGTYAPSGPPGTVVIFDPSQFQGSQVAANIFNFTTITIPAGVTVRLGGDAINGPVYWLAQGDVTIQGTIDLRGPQEQIKLPIHLCESPPFLGPADTRAGSVATLCNCHFRGRGQGVAVHVLPRCATVRFSKARLAAISF